MTLGDWLDRRRPLPPEALGRRIVELVLASEPGGNTDPAAACLQAAEGALQRLVCRGDNGRADALDLLAIDALVTYAFEAVADEPWRIEDLALDAMRRLSRVAVQ